MNYIMNWFGYDYIVNYNVQGEDRINDSWMIVLPSIPHDSFWYNKEGYLND